MCSLKLALKMCTVSVVISFQPTLEAWESVSSTDIHSYADVFMPAIWSDFANITVQNKHN